MSLINELLSLIVLNPPAIEARVLLMQQWIESGCLDAARDVAQELLRLDPSNVAAQEFLRNNSARTPPPPPTNTSGQRAVDSPTVRHHAVPKPLPLPRRPEDRAAMELELSEGYGALRTRAETLLRETRLVRDFQQRRNIESFPDSQVQDLKNITDGYIGTTVSMQPPPSARAVARSMEADSSQALDVAVDDLVYVVRWLRSTADEPSGVDGSPVRETLAKRVRILTAALPEDLQEHPRTALMHVEHEELERTYVNSETMLGDAIADIPRANFWISEDGYAWDMEELATCLASNDGVMRNPLSRQMFAADDVRAIVQHPLGQRLAALQIEQGRLSQGVRPTTVGKLDQLSAVLLADMSDDQMASRNALEVFLTYLATLPQTEQNSIDKLRVPATDSHTGQEFDCTIGEAVRDALANKICLHKAGDLIGQAARFLRQSNSSSSR